MKNYEKRLKELDAQIEALECRRDQTGLAKLRRERAAVEMFVSAITEDSQGEIIGRYRPQFGGTFV